MKKIIAFCLLLIISASVSQAWGPEGHFTIAALALKNLPPEMKLLQQWGDYIIKHSVDADNRKDYDANEEYKHYIDLDFYEEFNLGRMPYDKNQIIAKYGDSIVTQMGTLPWATLLTFENLVSAFKENNRDKVLIHAADLAHYAADGHQPMHTIINYNGQLTNQQGIHKKYETEMFNAFQEEITSSIQPDSVTLIDNPLEFIFGYITESHTYYPVLFAADENAVKLTGTRLTDEYFRLLWFKTKYVTVGRIEKAVSNLSSLYYSAWVYAGRPDMKQFN